ncbi:AAA family ATPase [Flavobacterium sp. ACAM 123]|uniref:AAA family ATPase n=1 Tax=Flavobacterium sp. ACAM 123 TaxID=1189620 RepID=UPI00031074A8|nr:AAA family ATPase [Flavobacterium sp. ACAM 123]
MRLKYIKINSDYLIFKKGEVFNFNLNEGSIENNINQKFNVITGSNGSGKTLLMSMLSNFFHNIDRFHERTNFDIEIFYEIKYAESTKQVTINSNAGKYYISIEDEFENAKILPNIYYRRYNIIPLDEKLYNEKNQTHFILIKGYLPKSIVLSIFSIHGEYPNNRHRQYIGDKMLRVYDISKLYGTNHFGLPTITRGISRFLKLMFTDDRSDFFETLKSLGFEFNNHVLINYDSQLEWKHVDNSNFQKIVSLSEAGEAYLNDLQFIRNEKIIDFSNMSTGEKMLIYRIISILSEIEDDSLVIVEEPEMHLDFSWNRQLISLFDTAFKAYNAHIIFITHNPYLINSLNKNQVLFLKNGTQNEIQSNTFQLGIEELFIEMFDDKFSLNTSELNVIEKISKTDNLDVIQKIYDNLGNSIYKYLAFQKIQKLKGDVEGK